MVRHRCWFGVKAVFNIYTYQYCPLWKVCGDGGPNNKILSRTIMGRQCRCRLNTTIEKKNIFLNTVYGQFNNNFVISTECFLEL